MEYILTPKVKSFAIQALRRASFRWPPRSQVAKDARVARGLYTCNSCKKEVRNKDKVIDHKIPIVSPVVGWTNFDDFISGLFCEKDNLQVLCNICNNEKTGKEQSVRRKGKKKVAP